MPIQLLDTGTEIKIPMCQYQINPQQQFAVLAIDFDKSVFTLGEHDGIEYIAMGKLNDQNPIFERQVINSLQIDGWDFAKYPNPEIILIQPQEDNDDEDPDDLQIISSPDEEYEKQIAAAYEEDEEVQTCRQCGCSENDPCMHQQYGPCWWVEDDLCSHCKNWPGESTRPNSLIIQ